METRILNTFITCPGLWPLHDMDRDATKPTGDRMRTIRFRAWRNDNMKHMFYPNSIYTYPKHIDKEGNPLTTEIYFQMDGGGDWAVGTQGFTWVNKDNGILMQYTGLKDVNGVEIYEGDIIKDTMDSMMYEVIWIDGGFTGSGLPIDYFIGVGSFEVIGNIYENPELIQ